MPDRDHGEKRLSARQAARLMFQTQNPSRAQVVQVQRAIQSGALPGRRDAAAPGRWVTTNTAVAAYLAHRSVKKRQSQYEREHRRQRAQRSAGGNGSSDQHLAVRTAEMNAILEMSLKNYLLHVLFVRRPERSSKRLRILIMAGQFVLLLLIGAILTTTLVAIQPSPPPAEHATIKQWLQNNVDDYRIQRMHPARFNRDDSSVVVKVEYHYRRAAGKGVDTIRFFTISDGQVVRVDSEL